MSDNVRLVIACYMNTEQSMFPPDAEVAVASPFTPFRSDNPAIEGINFFYEYTGLMPRLGLFEGKEAYIPVDLRRFLLFQVLKRCLC